MEAAAQPQEAAHHPEQAIPAPAVQDQVIQGAPGQADQLPGGAAADQVPGIPVRGVPAQGIQVPGIQVPAVQVPAVQVPGVPVQVVRAVCLNRAPAVPGPPPRGIPQPINNCWILPAIWPVRWEELPEQ